LLGSGCAGLGEESDLAIPNANHLILVTGATGKQGGAALRAIREHGFPVRAMTRNPDKPAARTLAGEGVEVVRADFEDPDSLHTAVDGAYGVFAMTTPFEAGLDAEIAQGKALAEAASRSNVTHYVYTSVGAADRNTGIPHFETKFQVEQHIQGLGFAYWTILRPVFFMENWLWIKDQIDGGTLATPLSPGTRLEQIAVADIGVFAALAFEHPDHWNRKAVELAGDELSGTEQAAAFSHQIGKPVQYVQVPWADYEKRAGEDLAIMYRWFEEHGYKTDIDALRADHPSLMTFSTWVRNNWK
jgi:uncharacterized protein YbjT (DUF2867 family)